MARAIKTATILGTKVSVDSWICVNAWSKAIMRPTNIAAPTAGPDPMIIVQIAARSSSNASASFMTNLW